jgi:hypothetical protein
VQRLDPEAGERLIAAYAPALEIEDRLEGRAHQIGQTQSELASASAF